MARVLVTGGAGFIGSSLVDALTELGYEIIVFDNLSTGNLDNISKWPGVTNFVRCDLLDEVALMRAVNSCELVFHLAANPEVRLRATDTRIDYEQNLLGTYNLLEAMRKSPNCKKIVFSSSSVVYGEPSLIPTSENYSPLTPISLYGATKLACEALISGYCHTFDMYGMVTRLANVVGPRSTHGVIFDFITKLSLNPRRLDILGDGKQNKSYIFIDDCVDALIHVSKMDRIFEIFNVGCCDKLNVLEIANIVIKHLSLKNVKLIPTGGMDGRGWKGDVKEMLLDSSRLITSGWHPKYNSRKAVNLATLGTINRLHKRFEMKDPPKTKTQTKYS